MKEGVCKGGGRVFERGCVWGVKEGVCRGGYEGVGVGGWRA